MTSPRTTSRRLRLVENVQSATGRHHDADPSVNAMLVTVDGRVVEAGAVDATAGRDASRVVLAVAAVGAVAFSRVAVHVARVVLDNV